MNTDRLKQLFKNVDASNDHSKYPNTIKKKNSNAIVAQHTPNNTYRESLFHNIFDDFKYKQDLKFDKVSVVGKGGFEKFSSSCFPCRKSCH